MRQYNVEISRRAAYMLDEHVRFLAQTTHVGAAKTKKEILATIATLSTLPERHPFIDDDTLPKSCYHKFLACKRYFILYQIKDDTVYVDYIIDCRHDPLLASAVTTKVRCDFCHRAPLWFYVFCIICVVSYTATVRRAT